MWLLQNKLVLTQKGQSKSPTVLVELDSLFAPWFWFLKPNIAF
jgi:hypothetical protein